MGFEIVSLRQRQGLSSSSHCLYPSQQPRRNLYYRARFAFGLQDLFAFLVLLLRKPCFCQVYLTLLILDRNLWFARNFLVFVNRLPP
jgi:hypothetical protein